MTAQEELQSLITQKNTLVKEYFDKHAEAFRCMYEIHDVNGARKFENEAEEAYREATELKKKIKALQDEMKQVIE